jgi:hypothetical protein
MDTDRRAAAAHDLDATLIVSHSEKEGAAGTFKRGFGFHPMLAYAQETGEALGGELRPGNAGANTAADQIKVLEAARRLRALASAPRLTSRRGRRRPPHRSSTLRLPLPARPLTKPPTRSRTYQLPGRRPHHTRVGYRSYHDRPHARTLTRFVHDPG